ncbi:AI-2E family transporter [Qiania dongpingensis]|uniref:AI-2E family transporter n=1 Tax=Qiania dongpingensis TaxID=2763669 RepID=A0A7G9G1S0_9FIRM|nr:AI-2E family transporter [Qiania dongpingensis]QNM04752.1 AI-2E family transporter [Qiania dongpingensis]
MELNKNNSKKILGFIAFGILLFVGLEHLSVVGNAFRWILGLLFPFLLGACIAFILNVPMRLLEEKVFRKLKGRKVWDLIHRPVCMLLSIIVVLAVLCLVIFLVVPELIRTVSILSKSIPVFMENAQAWLIQLAKDWDISTERLEGVNIDWKQMLEAMGKFLQDGAATVVNTTIGVTSSIVSGVVNFFLAFIFSLYILASKEKLSEQFRKLMQVFLPEKRAGQFLRVCTVSNRIFSSFVTGQCTEAVILGVLCFLGMTLLRLPYAMVIGTLVGFTALIPVFGAFIGCFIGAFLILIVSPVKAVVFIVFLMLLQQLEGNLIYPKVVGTSIGLPGIWVLVAVTVGGSVFGIAGMLLFVPLCSVIYTLLRESVYRRLKPDPAPDHKQQP